jgi:hypothetical protein
MCRMVLACLMFGYLGPVFWMFIKGVYLHYNKASYCAGVDVPDGAGLPDVQLHGPCLLDVHRGSLPPL